jgi:uncharacterized membrane protein
MKPSSNRSHNNRPYINRVLFCSIFFIGIALRLIQYLQNRSLWTDEAMLALNVIDKSFWSLLKPLDYNQVAPILFLFLEKFTIILFGNSEFALRLIPLLTSIVCIWLMYRFTKQITGNERAALIAMFLFSTSELIIDYSSELKQYQTDIFSALLMLAITFDSYFSKNEQRRFRWMAIAGMILIFLSNITVLVLFVIALYFIVKHGLKIFKHRMLLFVFTSWAIGFLIYYSIFIVHHPARSTMIAYWQDDFMPLNIFTSSFWNWFYERFVYTFIKFYAIPFIFIYLLSIAIFIIKKNYSFVFFLIMPLFIHFVLSGIKMYPYSTRTILYLTAFTTPFIAMGLTEIVTWLSLKVHKSIGIFILFGVLVFMPIVLRNNKFPRKKEEIKKSYAFIEENKRNQQQIYLYYGGIMATNYYRKLDAFPARYAMIIGHGFRDEPENYISEIEKMSGEVWLLFSHVYSGKEGNEEEFIINKLTQSGTVVVLKTFKTKGSSAYLIKFNKTLAELILWK